MGKHIQICCLQCVYLFKKRVFRTIVSISPIHRRYSQNYEFWKWKITLIFLSAFKSYNGYLLFWIRTSPKNAVHMLCVIFLAELCLKLTTDISMLLLQSVCEILYQTVLKVWNLMFHIKCILNLFLLKLYTQYTLVNSSWVCNNLSPSYIVLLYQCIILNFVCIMQFVSWLHLYKILIWMMIPFSLDFTH